MCEHRKFPPWLAIHGALFLLSVNALAVAQSVDAPSLNGRAITLRDALGLALEYSPALAVFDWDIRISEARRLQAGLRPNPELSLEIEEFRFGEGPKTIATSRSIGTGGIDIERETQNGASSGFEEAEFTLRLSQLIELGGKRAKRIRLAEQGGMVAHWDYEVARADVAANVANSFAAVLAAQERVLLASETVTLAQNLATAIQARVDAGKTSPIEATRTQVQHNQALIQKNNEDRRLEAARILLAAAWGATAATFREASGDFHATDPRPPLDSLRERVLDTPDFVRWAAELQRRDALLTVEKSRRIPDLTLTLGFRTTGLESRKAERLGLSSSPGFFLGDTRTRFDEGRDNTFVFEFSLPLPLFNRNQGSIREAEFFVEKGAAERRSLEMEIGVALRLAYEGLRAAIEEIESLEANVIPAAQRAFESIDRGYREGKFGYLEVLDAQRSLVAARVQRVDALALYHEARVQIDRLSGGQPLPQSDAVDKE